MKVENKIIFSSTGKHVCPTRMTITILVRSQRVDIILRKAIPISASVQLFPIFEILKDFKDHQELSFCTVPQNAGVPPKC